MSGVTRREFLGAAAGAALVGAAAVAGRGEAAEYEAEAAMPISIRRPDSPGVTAALAKKHVPVIECADNVAKGQPLSVKVVVPHVMLHEHFIMSIDVHVGEILVSRVTLMPTLLKAEATLTLTLPETATIRAVESCNLHGVWESTKRVQVG